MSRASWKTWRRKQITPELVEELAGYFRAGATPKIAAGRIGVPAGVLRMWLREGEAQLEELYDREVGYPEQEGLLYDACAKATAEYLMQHVETISDPDGRDWRASSWLLERRDDEFNPASRLEVTGHEGGPIAIEGKAVVGLADVIALAKGLGAGHLVGLDAGDTLDALPGPAPVLPDPSDPVGTASAVPDVHGS